MKAEANTKAPVATRSVRWLVALGLALASFFTIWGLHGDVVLHPNSYLLSSDGEGARVYFVLSSHARHDSSYRHFEGMNYPYGEHLVYCDAQPIVTNTFRAIVKVFPGFQDYAVGYQNALSLYSFIVAALLLYLLFVRWDIPPWYAACAAFAIMLIGPQVSRLPWHPGLAYPVVIPGFLLLYQQFFRTRGWKVSLLIMLVNAVLYLVNPYLGMMGSGLFLLTGLILWRRTGWKQVKAPLQMFVQTVLPGAAYYVWVLATDHHLDRVGVPTGFEQFTAQFKTVFTSLLSPLQALYEGLGVEPQIMRDHWEGWAYVGASVTFLLILRLGWWLYARFRKQPAIIGLDSDQKVLGWIAVLFLIIGMGIPFVWHASLEGLLDLFPPLRQLRAFGRVTWVFAIVFNVLAYLAVYRLINQRINAQRRWIGYAAALVLMSFTAYEGSRLHADIAPDERTSNVFTMEGLAVSEVAYLTAPLDSIDFSKYGAIIPLPYYHVGSELFVPPSQSSFRTILESVALSYHTGLPITGSHLSRLSRQEAMHSLQLFASPTLEKEIRHHIPPDRPLLLVYAQKGKVLTPNEYRLIKLGETVYDTPFLKLVEIWPEDIWATQNDLYAGFQQFRESYHQVGDEFVSADLPLLRRAYDNEQESVALAGGALDINPQEEHVLLNTSELAYFPAGEYTLSFWFEAGSNRPQSRLVVETLDAQSGAVLSHEISASAHCTFDFYHGWMRWELPVTVGSGVYHRYSFAAPRNLEHLYIDELWVLPPGQSAFVEWRPGEWLWNSWPVVKE